LWNFLSLAVADADVSIAISNNHKCGEGEATAALDDLCHTIDRNYAFNEWRLFNWRLAVFATAATLAAGTFSAAATLLPCCCSSHWVSLSVVLLEDQAALAGAFGQGRDAAGVLGSTAVKDHSFDASSFCTISNKCADLTSFSSFVASE
jgi:hypothetical protein